MTTLLVSNFSDVNIFHIFALEVKAVYDIVKNNPEDLV